MSIGETLARATSSPAALTARRLASRALPAATALAAFTLIAWRLRAFLSPHTLPARGDPSLPFQGSDLTPLHFPSLLAAAEAAWEHGTLGFWNPHANGGTPLFEAPEGAVLALATLLTGIAPAEAAIKWAALAHVALGMAGVWALARALRVEPPFAALGATAFGLGTFLLDHLRVGHLGFVYPMGLLPWALHGVWRAVSGERFGHRWALAGGAAFGLAVLEGGTTPLLYGALALCLLALTVPVGPSPLRHAGRVAAAGAVAGSAALGVAAVQLVPMAGYMALTGRGGGLTFANSWSQIGEVARPIPVEPFLAMMVLGAVALHAGGERRAAVWLSAVALLGFSAARVEAVYHALWTVVPGFRFQRIPERALVLVGIAGPVLVAAGAQALFRMTAGWKSLGRAVALGAVAWLLVAMWRAAPPTPPMASPAEERDANHALRWLAEHAGESRVHVWESPNRHWGADHATRPLGLRVLSSYTSSEHRDWMEGDFDPPGHRTFLSESYADPSKLWGMLGVRYVLSSVPRQVDGLRLAARVPPCPVTVCQPAKSAGTFVYENLRLLPRAWRVRQAVAVVGEPGPAFEAALDILKELSFDPARTVILQVPPGVSPGPVAVQVSAGAELAGLPRWGSSAAREAVLRALEAAPDAEPTAAAVLRDGPNRLNVDAPGEGWLVVGEKLGLFPGWKARSGEGEVPILRANGVLGALAVAPDSSVALRYRPPGLGVGLGALAGALVLGIALELLARRGRRARSG